MTNHPRATDGGDDRTDVVVVGGGPSGCSAAVFTARYGLDTVVFDRGNAALPRCAYLENYPGFPAGVEVETFQELLHAHVEEAGGDLIPETVGSVERVEDGGFVVETDADRRVTAEAVIAAAWYDGSYLRPLDPAGEMFHEHEHHGEVQERFDPDYPDDDGRTPVEGLYVASPGGDRSAQAVVAAGHGAHVARCLIEDRRREDGYTGGVAPHYDWLRPPAEFTGEWAERDRWREWFDNELDDGDLDRDRREALRERYVDEAFETRVSKAEREDRAARGLERLVEVLGPERVLDAVDDETLRAYLEEPPER